jgi:hypothetical protein
VDHLASELDVRALEIAGARFVEDADQIHHCGDTACELPQGRRIVDVRLEHVDRRQQQQVLGALATARRHEDAPSIGNEASHHVAPDEAASSQDEYCG